MDLDGNSECRSTVPTPFLFFGHYAKIKTPVIAPKYSMAVPCWVMVDDLQRELMSEHQTPDCEHNDYGNAYVPHLGTITMPQAD